MIHLQGTWMILYLLYTIGIYFSYNKIYISYSGQITHKSLHSENGVAQFELTFAPEDPLKACDELVLAKCISRLCAVKMKRRITFSPLVSEDKVGSGLHLHFSICNRDGTNINANENQLVSQKAGAFLSGILKHLNALTAFTSPSFISGLRYKPPRWTAYFNNFAIQDRAYWPF